MKQSKYHKDLGATVACTTIIMEATKGIGQKYRKGATKDCFLFDSSPQSHWPKVFELEDNKATYKWWRSKLSINGFNEV